MTSNNNSPINLSKIDAQNWGKRLDELEQTLYNTLGIEPGPSTEMSSIEGVKSTRSSTER